jgi:hypothetical protein
LDSTVNMELVTDVTNYNYVILYNLFRAGVPIAQLVIENEDDNPNAAPRRLTETPNLTWIDTPLAGITNYEIRVTIFGAGIVSAATNTSSLNATVF